MRPIATFSRRTLLRGAAGSLAAVAALPSPRPARGRVGWRDARFEFRRDDDAGRLQIMIDGKEAVAYCYGADLDLPHFYPVRSPSGQSMTVQQIEPYPHHRSVWFADTVQLAGRQQASFYNAMYSRKDPKDPKSPLRDRVRHVEFLSTKCTANEAYLSVKLLWEMDRSVPVLDELRQVHVEALGGGEYLADLQFTLAASHGDVEFVSDAVHYAWPFVRMSPEYSVQKGGTMTNSAGGVNQAKTHDQIARWVDYSNTVNGQTEGLALLSHSANDHPHRWLTRDYGTFGPRRADARSGKKFTLKNGESLAQRVGILVHRGDVRAGRVAERYESYVAGKGIAVR